MTEKKDLPELSVEAQHRIYRILCHMAHCDGEVDPRERDVLVDYQKHFGLSKEAASDLEQQAIEENGVFVGRDQAEREFLIDAMVELVAADALLDMEEFSRLQKTSTFIDLPEEILNEKIGHRFSEQDAD